MKNGSSGFHYLKKASSLFTFFLMIVISGCSQPASTTLKKYPVTLDEVIKQDVPQSLHAIGRLSASIEIEIRAQVSGILTNILFNDGDLVEEGDLLMTIDDRPFLASLKEAQATLDEDKARLRYALDFAETYEKLVNKEYVARLDYEQGLQNVDIYKAAIEADQAEVDRARINLGYTRIHSPTKGYVGSHLYDPGNYIDAAQDQVLVTVRKITPMMISLYVPADYVQTIRELYKEHGLFLEAYLPNDPKPLTGSLNFIDNNVNRKTGMIRLKGTIANEDERGWPGQFVRVNLILKILNDAILVPSNSIVLGQDGYSIYMVKEDMSVEKQSVVKLFEYKDYTVIQSPLKAGDKIVTDGQLNLFPGAYIYQPEDSVKEK
jgi:multidrug efflux system membrane fusion protein